MFKQPQKLHEKLIQIRPIEVLQKEKSIVNPDYKETEEEVIKFRILEATEKLQALEKQREKMLQNTVAEIEEQKQNWEKEKLDLIHQVKKSGFQSGYAAGKQESVEEYRELLDNANKITEMATLDYHSTVDQSESTIVKLAIHAAEKIVNQELTDNPEKFIHIVSNAIKEIKDQSIISIYLHPTNYKLMMEHKDELTAMLDGNINLSIYIDHDIKENSCLIDHPLGKVDASIDTQFNEIRDVLLEVVKENA